MWALFLFSAWAKTPVIHAENESNRVERWMVPFGDEALEYWHIDRLQKARPVALGDHTRIVPCTGSSATMAQVEAATHRAVAAYHHVKDVEAREESDQAVALLGCLSEPVNAQVAAKLFQLRGVIEGDSGRKAPAAVEFRTALSFDPELSLDSRYDAKHQPGFEKHKGAERRALVSVYPWDVEIAPTVDGHAVSQADIQVFPGLHLVQTRILGGFRTLWLVVEQRAALVDPGAGHGLLPSQLSDDKHQPAWLQLLATAFPEAPRAFVAHDGQVWEVTFPNGDWPAPGNGVVKLVSKSKRKKENK